MKTYEYGVKVVTFQGNLGKMGWFEVRFWRVWSCENGMVLSVCFSVVDGLGFWDGY